MDNLTWFDATLVYRFNECNRRSYNSNQHKFWNWTFSLSFPKLLTIHVIPRSRELIIHAISRVRQRVRSKQHVGLCVNQGVDQRQLVDYRRTVRRLSISYHWRFIWVNKFFKIFFWEINLSQMQFYFPPITNSNSHRKTGVFCSFVSQTSQRSGIIHSQTLVINFYSLQLLSKN